MLTSFPVRLFLTIYLGLSLLVQWVVSWLLQVIAIILTYPFLSTESRQDMCGYIFRFVSFVGTDVLNPFWRTNIVKPFPHEAVTGKHVLAMANHLSGADPFMLIRVLLPRDATWIAKDELFRIPFGGWSMGNAGDLPVHFKNKREGFETIKGTVGVMMEEARKKLVRGRMICVFPEGIRNKSPEKGLCEFRLGFFKLAVEEGATIVPIGITNSETCWPRGSLISPGVAYFSCGDPVDASKFATPEALRDHIYNAIVELRAGHARLLNGSNKKVN